jgi:hypothetical protein
MGITGVYKVTVTQFEELFDMELHIKEDKNNVFAALKDGVLTRSFYNCCSIIPRPDSASCNFNFYNVQIDEYADLRPPGGYHIGGVEFGGTVVNDEVIGTIRLRNGLVSAIYGKRIDGEPSVNTKFRLDGIPEGNRYCPCMTGFCPQHSFCDSCQIFESLHASKFKGNRMPIIKCLKSQFEKLYGPIETVLIDEHEKDLLTK